MQVEELCPNCLGFGETREIGFPILCARCEGTGKKDETKFDPNFKTAFEEGRECGAW